MANWVQLPENVYQYASSFNREVARRIGRVQAIKNRNELGG